MRCEPENKDRQIERHFPRHTTERNGFGTLLPRLGHWAGLLLLAFGLMGCNEMTTGIFHVVGVDKQLGPYAGLIEVRKTDEGSLTATRIVKLRRQRHDDGRWIELVWTGDVTVIDDTRAEATITLRRADFIKQVGNLVRSDSDREPLAVQATIRIRPSGVLRIRYAAEGDARFGAHETAIYRGPAGNVPLWRNGRFDVQTHDEISAPLKSVLFSLFNGDFTGAPSYYELPEVAPYVEEPAFQRALHWQRFDRTDYAFYQRHPDRLRVPNKVVDAISLAETEVFANAYRASLAEKATFYQDRTEELIDGSGMVLFAITPDGEVSDGSSALWTGIYALTQAQRYELDGDPAALEQLRFTVQALLTLMDITGDPTTFARSLRPAGPPLVDGWIRGEGEFSHLDWKEGGNNDMSKGLLLGMIAAWDVLPPEDPLRDAVRAHAMGLLKLDVFQDVPDDPDDGAAELLALICPLLPEPSIVCVPPGLSERPAIANLMAGILNDDASLVAAGLERLRDPTLLAQAALGGGPFYIVGITDFSGNHLTLTTRIIINWLLRQSGDTELQAIWRESAATAWDIVKKIEHPLDGAYALLWEAISGKAGQVYARSEVLWALRGFQLPKHNYPLDYTLQPDFVLDPFPQLPWKGDWLEGGRHHSLVRYSMPLGHMDRYRWNNDSADIVIDGAGETRYPGVDYLFLYWAARHAGIIDASQ